MPAQPKPSKSEKLKRLLIGPPLVFDSKTFHKISLIAFFAWVGLGADGLSSSAYGPEEAFRVLHAHPYLAVFVALATALTVFIIGASYTQIIELFPSTTGSGGYIVASKFLSPKTGMISGCALFIDYILTITVSVAAGAAAIFSFLPPEWQPMRLAFAVVCVLLLIVLNMRGVKESVLALAPVFILFVITHAFLIGYAVYMHMADFSTFVGSVDNEVRVASVELGVWGMVFLVLKAFSMGAGTYTGLEAVSNGIPILREPKIKTAKRTMDYMMVSLALTAGGLMLAYIFFNVVPDEGKTFNAILFEKITGSWGAGGYYFMILSLVSEAALLLVAAQAGFLDGPRVLANMALDGWVPKRFALISDRFVNQNGILIVGVGALALMVIASGSVQFLVVLYSINVFLTFSLSKLGTQIYFWHHRRSKIKAWLRKFLVCLLGLVVTVFILISVIILKFAEGGWVTILITGTMVYVCLAIKRHYDGTETLLKDLDKKVIESVSSDQETVVDVMQNMERSQNLNPKAKTAVVFVSGFNGFGVNMVSSIVRLFGNEFRNFVFVQIGVMDSGNFKGLSEVERLREHTKDELSKYVRLMRRLGYYSESIYSLGTDVADEVDRNIAPKILERYPDAVFFGGQIVFPRYSFLNRLLHNYTIGVLQRKLYKHGIQFVILPIKVGS